MNAADWPNATSFERAVFGGGAGGWGRLVMGLDLVVGIFVAPGELGLDLVVGIFVAPGEPGCCWRGWEVRRLEE